MVFPPLPSSPSWPWDASTPHRGREQRPYEACPAAHDTAIPNGSQARPG